jgi:UDP-N-acetylmuramate--alanine ligase
MNVHFVGIGGAGMSGIARILLARGATVSGSDAQASATTRLLEREGARVFVGHDASHVGAVDRLIYSAAVPADNPELAEAERRGIPIVRRDVALGELMAGSQGIAITGTHGKTTTTGMVASIFLHAELDPTVLIGGDLPLIGGNARVGRGPHLITEACEAFDSFLTLSPRYAAVTNIEADHLDYHGSLDGVVRAFQRFVACIAPDGCAVLNGDDPHTPALLEAVPCRALLFSVGPPSPHPTLVDPPSPPNPLSQSWERGSLNDHDFSPLPGLGEGLGVRAGSPSLSERHGAQGVLFAREIQVDTSEPRFTVSFDGDMLGEVRLAVPGMHNVQNALAALGLALAAGVPFEAAREGLAAFHGTGRRFELLGKIGGVRVIDDYAHHPTEVAATLATAREVLGPPITAVFQPHLYSRTRDQMEAFATSFAAADRVVITDIYAAREEPIPGVSAAQLADAIRERSGREVVFIPQKEEIAPWLAERLWDRESVLVLGAGDVREVGEALVSLLRERSGEQERSDPWEFVWPC